MRFLRCLADWSRSLSVFWARADFFLNFPNHFWKNVSCQLSLANAIKIGVWSRSLAFNFLKKSVMYQKKTSQEIFGGYIYLELLKKILFHQIRSLNAYSQRILQSGHETLRRLTGWLWSMSHKFCNSMQSLPTWPATGRVKKGGSGKFDYQCFKLWRSRRS